jgi:hypothetical protein
MSFTSASSNPQSTPHGGSSTAKPAASIAAAKQAAKMALAEHHNQQISRYYFVAMGGLVLIFAVLHWTRFTYSRYASDGTRKSALMKCQIAISR